MNARPFERPGGSCAAERALLTTLSIAVYDRGPEPEWNRDRSLFGPWLRYEAELVGFDVVRAMGMSPWEAVNILVANHRPLLERRWAPGGPAA